MTTYNPPHPARLHAYLDKMVVTILSGRDLPPIVVCGEVAITGSHRIAAYIKADKHPDLDRDLSIPTVEISDEEFSAAAEGLDPESPDFLTEVAERLHEATDRSDLREALSDQF